MIIEFYFKSRLNLPAVISSLLIFILSIQAAKHLSLLSGGFPQPFLCGDSLHISLKRVYEVFNPFCALNSEWYSDCWLILASLTKWLIMSLNNSVQIRLINTLKGEDIIFSFCGKKSLHENGPFLSVKGAKINIRHIS